MNALDKMTSVVREDPSITVKELTRKMGFSEQKSIYYWLAKQGYRGLREFKRAVLAQRHAIEVDANAVSEPGKRTKPITTADGHIVAALPVATGVSLEGTPVWSQSTIHLEVPKTLASTAYAIRASDLLKTGRSSEWLIVDPVEIPRDGQQVIASTRDGQRHICRYISVGSAKRLFHLTGEELTGAPAVITGVLKARLEYLT